MRLPAHQSETFVQRESGADGVSLFLLDPIEGVRSL